MCFTNSCSFLFHITNLSCKCGQFLDMPNHRHQVAVLGVADYLYLQCNKNLYHWNMFVSESIISIVMIMSIMSSSHGVQVTCVIRVVVGNEVCRGVRWVSLVLSIVLLRHGCNTNNQKITMNREEINPLEKSQALNT